MSKPTIVTLAIIAAVILLVVPLSIRYEEQHGMQAVRPFAVGAPTATPRVLIATQGSTFKDELVSALIQRLRARGAYAHVIDLSALPTVHEDEWTAVVLLHTWQFGKPPAAAQRFIDRVRDRHKLIVVTTSGSGHARIRGVDAISSASVVRDVPSRLAEIMPRLDALLRTPARPPAARP